MATTTKTSTSDLIHPRAPHRKPLVHVNLPEGSSFTMTHPTAARPGVTVTHIHPGGSLQIPSHWHETHSEYMRVTKGYMLITVGKVTCLFGPGDEPSAISPFVLHSPARGDIPEAQTYWNGRVQAHPGWEDEEVIFEKWTEPPDGQKELFFRNGIGYYKDFLSPC